MKRSALLLTIAMILVLALTACGKPAAESNTASGGSQTAGGAASGQAEAKNDEVIPGTDGDYVVFTVRNDFELEDGSGWLGVIPTGTKYELEADADEVDMLYTYAANFDDENRKDYRFEFEKEYFFGIGDGTYDLVLTSSDDAEVGKVLLQIGIEIKGDKITLDYENKK